jgi:hypothetical protein
MVMKGKNVAAVLAAFFLASSLLLLQLPGCGGGGGGVNSVTVGGGAATGTLQVGITDSPAFPEFLSVHITIDKVVAVPAGKEGMGDDDPGLPVIVTFPGGQPVDILNLHFLPQILGSTTIPAGSFSQIRLILAPNQPTLNNYVILASDPALKIPLTTPSAQQTGLKVIGNFTVTPGAFNTIVLDFNPNDAIVVAGKSGKIILKPTGIRISQVFNSLNNAGGVSGTIRSPLFEPWSSATVSVFPRDPTNKAVTSGVVFSNFSSPSVWKTPFAALVPPTGSAVMPSAHYKVFVQAYRDTRLLIPTFDLYSSPAFTVTTGVDTLVPSKEGVPDGIVLLGP